MLVKSTRNVWFTVLLFCSFNFGGKSQVEPSKKIELINSFIDSLLDKSITSEKIAKDFLFIEQTTKDSFALKTKALGVYIEKARNDIGKAEDSWSLINPKVFKLKHRNIFPYKEYKALDKVDLNISENEYENIYALLNNDKNEILQYFWIKDNKIYSFHLFVQGGAAWFFTY